MHHFLSILAASTPSTTAKGTAKSTGGSYTILVFIALIVAVYIFFIRPRSQRARQQQQQQKRFEVGDEVVSIGGITGRVVGLDDDEVEVEVADRVVLTFLRRAVNARNPAPPPAAGGGAPSGAAPGLGALFRGRQAAPATGAGEGDDEWEDSEFEGAGEEDTEVVVGDEGSGDTGLDDVDSAEPEGAGGGDGRGQVAGPAAANGAGANRAGGSRRRRNRRSRRGGGSGSSGGGR